MKQALKGESSSHSKELVEKSCLVVSSVITSNILDFFLDKKGDLILTFFREIAGDCRIG